MPYSRCRWPEEGREAAEPQLYGTPYTHVSEKKSSRIGACAGSHKPPILAGNGWTSAHNTQRF